MKFDMSIKLSRLDGTPVNKAMLKGSLVPTEAVPTEKWNSLAGHLGREIGLDQIGQVEALRYLGALLEGPVEVWDACVIALLDAVELETGPNGRQPKTIPNDEKFERYRVAEKIYDGGVKDLTIGGTRGEVDLIKKCVAMFYPVEIAGRIARVFDRPVAESDSTE